MDLVPGRLVRSLTDGCPGTVCFLWREGAGVGVRWDDGTTSVECVGEGQRWEPVEGWGHVCAQEGCVCPDDGEGLLYHRPSGTHACPRTECRYAQGLEEALSRGRIDPPRHPGGGAATS